MVSKKWVAFIGLIIVLCVIDTIAIVVTRFTPSIYSNFLSPHCVPALAIILKIILEVFTPYVRLVQYLGFLCLFVRQCRQQLNDRLTFINQLMSISANEMNRNE